MDTYYYEKLLEIQRIAKYRVKSRTDLTKAIDQIVDEAREEFGFRPI